MQVHASSLAKLEESKQRYQPDCIVSAVPVDKGNIEGCSHVLIPIADIYNAQLGAYKNAIRQLLRAEGSNFLIHCEHGQSRSAALAIIKAFQCDPTGTMAKRFLIEHTDAQPNPLLPPSR